MAIYKLTENDLKKSIKHVIKEYLDDKNNGKYDPRFSIGVKYTPDGDFWGEDDTLKHWDNKYSWKHFDDDYWNWYLHTIPDYPTYVKDSNWQVVHDIPNSIDKFSGHTGFPGILDYDKADEERKSMGEGKIKRMVMETVRQVLMGFK